MANPSDTANAQHNPGPNAAEQREDRLDQALLQEASATGVPPGSSLGGGAAPETAASPVDARAADADIEVEIDPTEASDADEDLNLSDQSLSESSSTAFWSEPEAQPGDDGSGPSAFQEARSAFLASLQPQTAAGFSAALDALLAQLPPEDAEQAINGDAGEPFLRAAHCFGLSPRPAARATFPRVSSIWAPREPRERSA